MNRIVKKIIGLAAKIFFLAVGFGGVIFLIAKELNSTVIGQKTIKDSQAPVVNQEKSSSVDSFSDSISQQDSLEENGNFPQFPIILDTWQVTIEIEDYYFEEVIPKEVEDPIFLEKELRSQFPKSFNEDGSFKEDILFLVMKVKVRNNLQQKWTYMANSTYVVFGESADNPRPFMNELFYFSNRQREGHESMHYEFEEGEMYSATYVFEVQKDYFSDDKFLCLLEINDNGSYRLEDTDRILILDKARRKSEEKHNE